MTALDVLMAASGKLNGFALIGIVPELVTKLTTLTELGGVLGIVIFRGFEVNVFAQTLSPESGVKVNASIR